ncbi:zinc metalloprotease [Flavobacterium ardleyense]|uniref:Zinc metalloprotease n=1 Tax=Flavobacterium ardleyense TaxID=2038737 RepID=A0ABW5Z9W8_9FLAO
MKKLILSAFALTMLLSCSNEDSVAVEDGAVATAHRGCASHDVLERQLAEDPSLSQRMAAFDLQAEQFLTEGRIVNGVLEIPVVFNVLYKTGSENITDAQLQSQITVLNNDFNATNADYVSNNPFNSVRGGLKVKFTLDGVNRKATTKASWGTNDAMKKSSQGGINPTSPTTKLNYWVCTIGGGILGYAQFPGGSSATDGVVIDSKYTGTSGTASYPFNKGRTATHEVGHWMNLRHIWGDANCGNDQVADTPTHNAANSGVPAVGHRSTCSGQPLEMYMNYMDYTDDRGMYMFSKGQVSRMSAAFASSGPRSSFR